MICATTMNASINVMKAQGTKVRTKYKVDDFMPKYKAKEEATWQQLKEKGQLIAIAGGRKNVKSSS